ncbi:MAG: extracellular solute-binding protein [Lachnospiraceae bacterium]|nr:extracellular solute-binding protein [Lachnospiraceae bacterium]
MKKRKSVALALCLVLASTSLYGCGKNSSSTATTTDGKGEKKTVSVMTFDFSSSGGAMTGENAQKVIDYVEDYTNTNLEFQFVPSDSYEDKLSLTLASGSDMPMIITVGSFSANIVNNARAGAFWDLSKYIYDSEKYPNLSRANKSVNESISVDGKLYGVYRARALGRYGFGYRADWAEKLGISKPETIEDFYNMLYAFTYNDPDGNGVDDTYGLNLCKYTGPLDVMQTWFGCGNGWVEKNGELVPVHMTDEYMEALEWFKKLYDDGLIAKDWAVRDTATWQNDNKNGVAGVYVDMIDGARRIWDYYETEGIPSVMNDGTNASMELMGGLAKEKGGEVHSLATSGYNGFFVITKGGAKTEEDLEACLHFLDKMCDDDMLITTGYGLEGIHWERGENNKYVQLSTDLDIAKMDYDGLNQVVAYIPTSTITGLNFDVTDRVKIQNQLYADNEKDVVFNPAAAFMINSNTYTLNGANLDTIISDARTQYIVGEIDKAGLQAAWDLWSTTGGADVIKEVNEAYKASK